MDHRTKTPRGASGFTFLEVLIALCVVLLALVPLLRLHMVSIRMLDVSSHRAQAVLLAQNTLAELTAGETLDLGSTSGRVEDANDGAVYRWSAVVTEAQPAEVESMPLVGLRQVRVEVVWEDGGHDALVSLDTYVYSPTADERRMLKDRNGGKNDRPTTRSAAPVL